MWVIHYFTHALVMVDNLCSTCSTLLVSSLSHSLHVCYQKSYKLSPNGLGKSLWDLPWTFSKLSYSWCPLKRVLRLNKNSLESKRSQFWHEVTLNLSFMWVKNNFRSEFTKSHRKKKNLQRIQVYNFICPCSVSGPSWGCYWSACHVLITRLEGVPQAQMQ